MQTFHIVISAISGLLICPNPVVAQELLSPYYTTTDLGAPNPDAALGNPLKGFLTNPDWNSEVALQSFPSSLEFYYIGLDEVMTDYDTFDWEASFEGRLDDTVSRNRHAILRFILDTPNQATQVPQFLIDGGLTFNEYSTYGGGQSPDYNDLNLKKALQQFIAAFGEKYDGDTRIAFVQVGLLGFWGEWHTYTDGSGETEDWIPESLKDDVISSFSSAMTKTKVQIRYPSQASVNAGFGLHDDSFAYATLEGQYNGGENVDWFFWPRVESEGYTSFWKNTVMGGEIYPPLQSTIFSDSYPAGSSFHQDFLVCTSETHATYMLNNYAFSPGYTGQALDTAIEASHLLGYSFQVPLVEVAEKSGSDNVAITVKVKQVGVAPFYYPLSLKLSCPGMTAQSLPGVETIIEGGSSKRFTFNDIPTTKDCLDEVEISLISTYAYESNPVKFSQGTDGSKVSVSLPLPSDSCVDSTLKFWVVVNNNGKRSWKDCNWVKKQPTRCERTGVKSLCPSTCGSCDTCVNAKLKLKIIDSNEKVFKKKCGWVKKKKNLRCQLQGVSDTCRIICDNCGTS